MVLCIFLVGCKSSAVEKSSDNQDSYSYTGLAMATTIWEQSYREDDLTKDIFAKWRRLEKNFLTWGIENSEILNLYNKALSEDYDVVFARRKERKDGYFKVLVSKTFYKIYSWASSGNYDPALCNFSISKRMVVDSYCKMREVHRAFVIYIKWLGFKQGVLDVEHNERKEGKSSYNFKKRMQMAMSILTSQSDKLLKFAIGLGVCTVLVSGILILWIIIRYFTMHIQPGWSSIVAAICMSTGILMLCIGIVGIYVGNIFMQVKERPLYVIRTIENDYKPHS